MQVTVQVPKAHILLKLLNVFMHTHLLHTSANTIFFKQRKNKGTMHVFWRCLSISVKACLYLYDWLNMFITTFG